MYILSQISRNVLVCKAFLGKAVDFDLEWQGYKIIILLLRAVHTGHSPGGHPTKILNFPYEVV